MRQTYQKKKKIPLIVHHFEIVEKYIFFFNIFTHERKREKFITFSPNNVATQRNHVLISVCLIRLQR